MEKKLISFIQHLRGAGVRISVAESLDSFRAIEAIGIEDKELLRDTFRTTLIKEVEDHPVFEKLFDLFFSAQMHQKHEEQGEGEGEPSEGSEDAESPEQFGEQQNSSHQKSLRFEDRYSEKDRQEIKEARQRYKERKFLEELEKLKQQMNQEEGSDSDSNSKDGSDAEEQFREELEKAQRGEAEQSPESKDQSSDSQQAERDAQPAEQRESEGKDEVAPAASESSEDAHGGSEATKDIQESPNSADAGQKPGSQSAEGLERSEGEQGNQGQSGQQSQGEPSEGQSAQQGQEGSDSSNSQGQSGSSQGSGIPKPEPTLSQKITQALQEGEMGKLEEVFKDKARQLGKFGVQNLKKQLPYLVEDLGRSLPYAPGMDGRWQEINDALQKAVEAEALRRYGEEALKQLMELPKIEDIKFSGLNGSGEMQDVVEEMRKRVMKMARKLASRFSRRSKQAKRGKVDIRRTIRKSLQTGGVPVELAFREKKLAKPELVILCDVSGSVAYFSEFMLQLVYAMQGKFVKVRSFAFVDCIDEISEYFKETSAQAAIQAARQTESVSWNGYSDFGNSFREFADKYLDAVTDKTTVIVLGDARNNENYSEQGSLRLISERAKKLIWLNPESSNDWDTGDSIMSEYASVCDQVFECSTLAQLEQVAHELIK